MKFLSLIGALAILAAIAAGVFFFGGFYNIAATEPALGIVTWALEHVREASIDRHATAPPPASFDSPANVQAGARAYAARGCVNCHGAPGVTWAKFSEGLHPDPPDLKDVADDRPGHIFWVIKNGINMTGMPSFEKAGVNDKDIWSIVAFVKKFGTVKPEDYKAWTAAP